MPTRASSRIPLTKAFNRALRPLPIGPAMTTTLPTATQRFRNAAVPSLSTPSSIIRDRVHEDRLGTEASIFFTAASADA
ncbi:hypothetical protein A5N83_11435 [Rhodococcus sp. 1139]|nr:hypothetical protein A5N83_11435 [Rhodococcus sp. 1139]